MDRLDNGQQVPGLIDAGEIESIVLFIVCDGAGGDLGDELMPLVFPIRDIVLFVGEADRRLLFMSALGEDGFRFGMRFADDYGDAGFDDAGLFEGDLRESVAEE